MSEDGKNLSGTQKKRIDDAVGVRRPKPIPYLPEEVGLVYEQEGQEVGHVVQRRLPAQAAGHTR